MAWINKERIEVIPGSQKKNGELARSCKKKNQKSSKIRQQEVKEVYAPQLGFPLP